MLFHQQGLLWLGLAVRYNYFRPYELGQSVGVIHVILIMRCMEYLADSGGAKSKELLTCIPCKLLEHIVCSNIMDHLDQYNLLSDKQHAFRKWHSCET